MLFRSILTDAFLVDQMPLPLVWRVVGNLSVFTLDSFLIDYRSIILNKWNNVKWRCGLDGSLNRGLFWAAR